MSRRAAIATYRAFFGVLALAAVATQFIDVASRGLLDPLHFFSYFTIESNLFAAAVLLVLAARRNEDRSQTLDLVRGAAVAYMTVTGIVFSVLLANTNVDTAIPWVNDVVHSIMPIVMVADWLLDPPRRQLTIRQGLAWLAYPFVWLVYTLVKGPIVGKYPYPFLNPANGGYATVAIYCIAILVGFTAVCLAAVWVANVSRDRSAAAIAQP
ncbi:MAG: Pr6Pr family membrane protein [Chloroflexota bacterium]|nr:Pr6Pr family membrane protein [Chloroflexota bacterium]